MKSLLSLLLFCATTFAHAQSSWQKTFSNANLYYSKDSVFFPLDHFDLCTPKNPDGTTFSLTTTHISVSDAVGVRKVPIKKNPLPTGEGAGGGVIWQVATNPTTKTGRIIYTYHQDGTLRAILKADGYTWLVIFFNPIPTTKKSAFKETIRKLARIEGITKDKRVKDSPYLKTMRNRIPPLVQNA